MKILSVKKISYCLRYLKYPQQVILGDKDDGKNTVLDNMNYHSRKMMVFPYRYDGFPYPMDPMMVFPYPRPYDYIPYKWPALLVSPPAVLSSCSSVLLFWLVPYLIYSCLVDMMSLYRYYLSVVHPLHTAPVKLLGADPKDCLGSCLDLRPRV